MAKKKKKKTVLVPQWKLEPVSGVGNSVKTLQKEPKSQG